MKKYDKNYEATRLQRDDSGLICNPNWTYIKMKILCFT